MDQQKFDADLIARVSLLEIIASVVMADRFRADPNPQQSCDEWFDLVLKTHRDVASRATSPAERTMGAALIDAAAQLRESTRSLLA